MLPRFLLIATIGLLLSAASGAQTTVDGRLFDEGRTLTERSERAPDALDQLGGIVGQWDVEITTHPTDSTTYTTTGQADITLMNRGWAYMERLYVDDWDKGRNPNNVMAFLTFNPSSNQFEFGVASSYTEHIALYDGAFENNKLVMTSAVRRLGGGAVTLYRMTYTFQSTSAFSVVQEESADLGRSWSPSLQMTYNRRTASDNFMAVRDDYGVATSPQPEEARQFDFLLGEWTANHNMLLGGNWVQFPTTTTAVFVMGGHAILEHNWFSLDPNHPEAATSIIRLYNRAERRWESLYLNNRSNSLLHFGGAWEGDRMVLHSFNTNRTDTISRWVFHSFEPDRYQWFAESSTDLGATFNETWTIDIVRK